MQSHLSVSACRRHLPPDLARRPDPEIEALRAEAYKMANVIIALYDARTRPVQTQAAYRSR